MSNYDNLKFMRHFYEEVNYEKEGFLFIYDYLFDSLLFCQPIARG